MSKKKIRRFTKEKKKRFYSVSMVSNSSLSVLRALFLSVGLLLSLVLVVLVVAVVVVVLVLACDVEGLLLVVKKI